MLLPLRENRSERQINSSLIPVAMDAIAMAVAHVFSQTELGKKGFSFWRTDTRCAARTAGVILLYPLLTVPCLAAHLRTAPIWAGRLAIRTLLEASAWSSSVFDILTCPSFRSL